MRLQLNPSLVCEVRHVGKLALIGTAEKYGKDGDSTIVMFFLSFPEEAPLAGYFCPQYGFRLDTLLFEIFVGEGIRVMESTANSHWRCLVFTREVVGNLRDPRKFLHATVEKLLRELQTLEDDELSMQELENQINWADAHFLCECPMPDFTHPRHD